MSDPTREELQEWADVCAQAALLALAEVPCVEVTYGLAYWADYVAVTSPAAALGILGVAPRGWLRQSGFCLKHGLPHNDPYSTAQYLYYLRDQLLKEIANDA